MAREKPLRQGRAITFWAVVTTTVLVFVAMQIWAKPVVCHEGTMLPTFDARICGYDIDATRTYLTELPEAEKRKYLDVMQRLDLVFPLLLAITIGWWILRLTPKGWGRVRCFLPLVVLPAMFFDYLENMAVAHILNSGPEELSPDFVRFASDATRMKFLFLVIELMVPVALTAMLAYRRWVGGKT